MELRLRDDQLRILWIARIDYSNNSGVKLHTHSDFHQLVVVIAGAGEIQIGEKTYPVQKNTCYFCPREEKHSFLFSETTNVIDLKFQVLSPKLCEILATSRLSEPLSIASHLNPFKELFHLSTLYLKSSKELLPYRIDVDFKSVLLSLLQNPESLAPCVSNLDLDLPDFPVVKYLREQLHSKITLEDLAKHFGFHPHYLVELFRKHLGISPMRYLQNLRIEKAKEYLEFTSLSVKEIANYVGLTPFYLSRLFAEREGISLTQYREQHRMVIGRDIILEGDFSLEGQPIRWKI